MFGITALETAVPLLHAAVLLVVLVARVVGAIGLGRTLLLLALALVVPVVGPVVVAALLVGEWRDTRGRMVVSRT